MAPAAPDGQLFFEGGDRIFPDFLKRILADDKIEGGKFHIAGPSNGGIAAMHVVEKGQPHRLETLAGEHAGRLFEGFEEARKGCSS